MLVKTFNVVSMVMDTALDKHQNWVLATDASSRMTTACSILDILLESAAYDKMTVSVNEVNMGLDIIIETDELVIDERKHPIYMMLRDTSFFSFENAGEALMIRFCFSNLWITTDE